MRKHSDMAMSKRIAQLQHPFLPYDLIAEIILRLPFKSMVRFKCVSKSFQSLLSSPQFDKEYDDFHIYDHDHILFFNDQYRPCLLTTKNGHDGILRDVNLPHFEPKKDFFVAGSCHGLVLIMQVLEDFRGLLVNPITLETIQIPKIPLIKDHTDNNLCGGLGYDSSKKDFKIVTISCTDKEALVYIFSLKTKTWRNFGYSPYIHRKIGRGAFVNGCLHWVSMTKEENQTCVIAAFNLATEVFENVPYPRGFKRANELNTDLIVLDGCLAMVPRSGLFKGIVHVWMMKKYGVQDSWTKFTIEPFDLEIPVFQIVGFKDEGEVFLIKDEGKFVVYNWRKRAWRDIVFDGTSTYISEIGITSFKESLISQNWGSEQ